MFERLLGGASGFGHGNQFDAPIGSAGVSFGKAVFFESIDQCRHIARVEKQFGGELFHRSWTHEQSQGERLGRGKPQLGDTPGEDATHDVAGGPEGVVEWIVRRHGKKVC